MAKTRRRTRKTREKTNAAHTAQVEQHIRRKGPQPGDPIAPTPERMAWASRAEEEITPILERTHTGNPTGRVTWQVEPTIERMRRNGGLREADYQGILEFWDWCEAFVRYGNAKTSSYKPRMVDGGQSEYQQQEMAHQAGDVLWTASHRLSWMLRPMLIYISGDIPEDMSLQSFMWNKYPHTRDMGERMRRQEGQTFIRMAAAELACYFGKSGDSFAELRAKHRRVAEELYELKKIA